MYGMKTPRWKTPTAHAVGVSWSEELDGCYKSIATPIARIIAASTLEDIRHQYLSFCRYQGVLSSLKLDDDLNKVRHVICRDPHLVSHIWYTLRFYEHSPG